MPPNLRVSAFLAGLVGGAANEYADQAAKRRQQQAQLASELAGLMAKSGVAGAFDDPAFQKYLSTHLGKEGVQAFGSAAKFVQLQSQAEDAAFLQDVIGAMSLRRGGRAPAGALPGARPLPPAAGEPALVPVQPSIPPPSGLIRSGGAQPTPPARPAPVPTPATPAEPTPSREALIDAILPPAGLPAGTRLSLTRKGRTFSIEGGGQAPDLLSRASQINDSAGRLLATPEIVLDAAFQAGVPMPKDQFDLFAGRAFQQRYRETFAETRGTLPPVQAEREAARRAFAETGYLDARFAPLIHVSKDEAVQDATTAILQLAAQGRSPAEAMQRAELLGHVLPREDRRALMERLFSEAFTARRAAHLAAGKSETEANQLAAKEAAALTNFEGVPREGPMARLVMPELPPLPDAVEMELQTQGTTGAVATPTQKRAAQTAARTVEVEQAGRRTFEEERARHAAAGGRPLTPSEAQAAGVPLGTTLGGAAGLFTLNPEERQRIGEFSSVETIVARMENLSAKLHAETPLSRLLQGPRLHLEEFLQTNPDAVEFERLRNSSISIFARVVGQERGALAEGDIKRAGAALPRLGDTREVAQRGFRQFREIIQDIQEARARARGPLGPGGQPLTPEPSRQRPTHRWNPATNRLEPVTP